MLWSAVSTVLLCLVSLNPAHLGLQWKLNSCSSVSKGRTIRKVMGRGGEVGPKQKYNPASENQRGKIRAASCDIRKKVDNH